MIRDDQSIAKEIARHIRKILHNSALELGRCAQYPKLAEYYTKEILVPRT